MHEGDENWHEVGDVLCRQNDIIGFGIVRAQRTKLLVKRPQQGALQALQAKSEALQSSMCVYRAQFRALLLHANSHYPPALLATTFRLKQDKLIRYLSHPF